MIELRVQEVEDASIANVVRVVSKKHPQAAESIADHTFRCGVLFEQSRSQRRSIASARRPTRALLAPRRRTSMIVKRCVRERGIHALHSFGSCCRAPPSRRSEYGHARPTEQSSATLGLTCERSSRLCRLFSLRCWYGSRTRDSQIIGLVLYPLS